MHSSPMKNVHMAVDNAITTEYFKCFTIYIHLNITANNNPTLSTVVILVKTC